MAIARKIGVNMDRRPSSKSIVIDLFEGKPVGGETTFMLPNSSSMKAGFLTDANIVGIKGESERLADFIRTPIAEILQRNNFEISAGELDALTLCCANSQPFGDLIPIVTKPHPVDVDLICVALLSGNYINLPTAATKEIAELLGVSFEARPSAE
jgi:hypothetical protein